MIEPGPPLGIVRRERSRVLVERLGQLVLVLLAVSLAVFLVTQVAPGDAARLRLGPRASDETVQTLRKELGVDRSVVVQYVDYLGRVVRGDLGHTINGTAVASIIKQRAPDTALLLFGSLVGTVLLAVPTAILAAWRRDRPIDHGIRILTLIALFLPSFWLGFVLIRGVAIPTGWFPVSGLGEDAGDKTRSLVLPSFTIACASAPVLVRSLRSSLVEVLGAEYVALARSLGVGRLRLALLHVLRNAAAPTITLLAFQLGFLLFGVVVVEYTFDIPGLGSALVEGAAKRDVFLVQGITLVFALGVVVASLVGDLLVAAIDPRVELR
jgi:peptide/nickel transport system permease protein